MARFVVYLCGNRDGFGRSLGTLLVLCMGLLFAAPLRNIESVGRRFGESRRCDRDYYRYLAILVAAMIRLGNLMNHEIYGHVTTLPWGFRFIQNLSEWMKGAAPIFTEPSHPTQIYEALCYLLLFGLLLYMYWKRNAEEREGLIFGTFLIGIFLPRFCIEFIKNNQEVFEETMLLNMGQLLSIPFVIAGVWLVIRALSRPRVPIKFAKEKKK